MKRPYILLSLPHSLSPSLPPSLSPSPSDSVMTQLWCERPLTAVEPPRDRRRVASLLFHDCTAVVLRRHGGDGGATMVLVRCHGGHGGAAATPLRIGPTRGGTAEVLNMLTVSAVPPRRSAVLTVFRGATAITVGTTAEPRRS